jgi:hypothetical protein
MHIYRTNHFPCNVDVHLQDKVKEAKAAKEAEAQAREERLARLRALVAPEVEADPLRLLLPTGEVRGAVRSKLIQP